MKGSTTMRSPAGMLAAIQERASVRVSSRSSTASTRMLATSPCRHRSAASPASAQPRARVGTRGSASAARTVA
jgi:hypothetical protein